MIRVFSDLEGISQAAAEIFVDLAVQAIAMRGRFSVALSGGNTPRRLHEILAEQTKINWQAIHIFWGDERCVPADDSRSNFRMARETLFSHVPLPAENIHTMRGDLSPADAASQYELDLRAFFGDAPPILDLVFLGLGDNAHTASLFPRTPVLAEKERWVSEVYVAELDMHRITLTAPLINQADQVVFLVSGADKAAALQKVLEGAPQPLQYPAQLIHPASGHPIWLVDKAAGQKLATPLKTEDEY